MTTELASLAEVDLYARKVQNYQQSLLSDDEFTAIRLQHGIYGQRQENKFMVRIKVPGGVLQREQIAAVGDALEKYSDIDFVNITTRQDLQLHFVPLAKTPEVMRELAQTGLTTREACGNTVRNVTACPLAGICKKERTDVRSLVDDTATHFLRHPLTQHLPRKFKISFSACEADCAQGMMHDLGVVAVRQGEKNGFRVLAGGGLGHKPREAIELESCVDENELMASIEAAICLHHRYSDRRRRAKSRLKFLVERFGEQGFIEKYRDELTRTKAAIKSSTPKTIKWFEPQAGDAPGPGAPTGITAQRQLGKFSIPIEIQKGDLNRRQIRSVVKIMENFDLQEVRTTQDQNLVLNNVSAEALDAIKDELAKENLTILDTKSRLVACPGNWTCRLGITNARALTEKLSPNAQDLRINISGCHNGCAQPTVTDIGLHGEGKRLFGKLIPFYQFHLGGDGTHGGGLAVKGPQVPSTRAVPAINRIVDTFAIDKRGKESFRAYAMRKGTPFFTELLEDFTVVGPDDLSSLLRDHGSEGQFQVLQLGGGECAGIAQESISALLGEIQFEQSYRRAFIHQGMIAESLACSENILSLAASTLLNKYGKKPTGDLYNLCEQLQNADSHLRDFTLTLHALMVSLNYEKQHQDKTAASRIAEDVDRWSDSVKKVLDGVNPEVAINASLLQDYTLPELDLTYEDSPFNLLRIRKALKHAAKGVVLPVALREGNGVDLVRIGLSTIGYKILLTLRNEKADRSVLYVLNTATHDILPAETTEHALAVQEG